MKRSPLRRKKPLRARKPLPKVNRARKARLSEEQYGAKEFREWIHAQPCVMGGTSTFGPIEQAHVRSKVPRGTGTWRDTVPMRRRFHRALHDMGIETFQARFDVDLARLAQDIQERWSGR